MRTIRADQLKPGRKIMTTDRREATVSLAGPARGQVYAGMIAVVWFVEQGRGGFANMVDFFPPATLFEMPR